ncbi:50S ribosomal protein L15 [Candidatus Tremblaya phenacola]|uniref:Large ribosomal subunit protein uL15 n=1 Tax=Candidatus Tremblayella phenacoccinincola TaxID=1010676 RepID=A0A2G0V6V1_9PROT|nr:50S ribosomal protein L15 [Candidatus Tremblaya phenacola]PHN16198.1 50S ribosomal protein L15 [Candidatus Tremblaya phenacola]
MKLNELKPTVRYKQSVRLGRGLGSKKGKTSGRGHKGQKSRTGGTVKTSFEGGQTPIQRRVPKLGFTRYIRKHLINLNYNKTLKVDLCYDTVSNMLLRRFNLVGNNAKTIRIYSQG